LLPGSVAEWLALFGGIDSGDAYSVLYLAGVEDGYRVAVSNLDDGVFEDAGFGVGGGNREDKQQNEDEQSLYRQGGSSKRSIPLTRPAL